ncbi:hypothetical protein DEIPH_ctg011orf0013 [Deinococcus phoenicis]|uniref:DUF3168 domain-containing protein n=1 Tax=Deinococcus phoenicis TaxID=1476583 RepID=A0A016QTG2_9DEIO|nr:DUF3168 domain-containing protein [Deinococcus phoenicis]EYB69049.1 hypothetical protein DEIPH_ctg011orf0013 [Deinococcus phoenicis]
MKAVLQARADVKATLKAAGLPTVFPDEAAPSGAGPYGVVTVISAPPEADWGGEWAADTRVQLDVWALSAVASAAALPADTARLALEGAGWQRVPSGAPPLSFEGERDAQGRVWHRASMDFRRLT